MLLRKFLLCCLIVLAICTLVTSLYVLSLGEPDKIVLIIVPISLCFLILIIYLFSSIFIGVELQHLGMEDAARILGLSYSRDASKSLQDVARNYSFIQRSSVITDEICSEESDVSFRIFRFTQHMDSERGRQIHTAVIMPKLLKEVPSFTLTPKTLFFRFSKLVQGNEISFTGTMISEEFSNAFVVRSSSDGSDEEVRTFFDEPLMKNFSLRKTTSVQSLNGSLLVWYQPSVMAGIRRAMKSVRAVVREDAKMVLKQSLDIYEALSERTQR